METTWKQHEKPKWIQNEYIMKPEWKHNEYTSNTEWIQNEYGIKN